MEQNRRKEVLAAGDKLFNEFKDIALRIMEFSRAATHEGCNHHDTRTAANTFNRMQLLYVPWHQRLQDIKAGEKKAAEAMRANAKKKAAPIATPKEKMQEIAHEVPETDTEENKPATAKVLDQMTVLELRKVASKMKIKEYMKMKKDQLLKAIRNKK